MMPVDINTAPPKLQTAAPEHADLLPFLKKFDQILEILTISCRSNTMG